MDRTEQAATGAPAYQQEVLNRGSDRLGLHTYPPPPGERAPAVVVWPAMGTDASPAPTPCRHHVDAVSP